MVQAARLFIAGWCRLPSDLGFSGWLISFGFGVRLLGLTLDLNWSGSLFCARPSKRVLGHPMLLLNAPGFFELERYKIFIQSFD
jgi:hypothetical protein